MKKKQTKQKIKEISLKIINIIGYVCIGLVLVLGILTGVNSCKNKQGQSAKVIKRNDINEIADIDSNNYVFYQNKYNSLSYGGEQGSTTFSLDLTTQASLIDLYGGAPLPGNDYASGSAFLSFGFGQGVLPNVNLYWNIPERNVYLLNNDGQLIPLTRIYMEFTGLPGSSGSSVYYYRLSSVRSTVPADNGVLSTSGNFRVICRNYGTIATDYGNYRAFYGFVDTTVVRQYLVTAKGVTLPDWLLTFVNKIPFDYTQSFLNFNPNGLYGTSSSSSVIINIAMANNVERILKGYNFFFVNGDLYTSIHLFYIHLAPGEYYINPNAQYGFSAVPNGRNDYGYFSRMEYWNDFTGTKIVVAQRLHQALEEHTAVSTEIRWSSIVPPEVHWYDTTRLMFETNQHLLGNMNNGFVGSITQSFDNPFVLISTMFSSLAPLFNIQILPYISIGVLIAVPLIAMIVYAIVKLIKK